MARETFCLFKLRILYDFLGFEAHVRQIRERRGAAVPKIWYERPAYFIENSAPDKIFGSGPVTIPAFVKQPDYECEVALVVNAAGRPTSVSEAVTFIQKNCFFTLMNDWSARDIQKLDMEMGMSVAHSKSVIGTSLGPALAAANKFSFDAAGNPDILVQLIVNGEVRTEANTNTAYWGFAKILAFLGRENIGVHEGDVLGSGTVGGGSIAESDRHPWLKNGDVVTLKSEKIGALTNTVRISHV